MRGGKRIVDAISENHVNLHLYCSNVLPVAKYAFW
jgi:hypothetical protein